MKYYNVKVIIYIYTIDDMIHPNEKDICSVQLNKKLKYKFHRLYKILIIIKMQMYKLQLSLIIEKIHLVFHVSKFKFYILQQITIYK